MRRALATLAAAACVWPLAVDAQSTNPMNQAVSDTVAANVKRSYPTATDAEVRTTIDRTQEAVRDAAVAGGGAPPGVAGTWAAVMRGLTDYMTWPMQIGVAGCKWQGVSFCGEWDPPTVCPDGMVCGSQGWYGGGTNGSWGEADLNRANGLAGAIDCGDVKYELDAQGNLIIPAMPLPTGGVLNDYSTSTHKGTWYYVSGRPAPAYFNKLLADSYGAGILYGMHEVNKTRIPQKWFGAVGWTDSQHVLFASVAYRDSTGTIQGRETYGGGAYWEGYVPKLYPGSTEQITCPPQGYGGGDFHFYEGTNGPGGAQNAIGECIMYAPNPSLGFQGYAMNSKTTIPASDVVTYPRNLPDILKRCPISPSFLQKLVDSLKKKACAKPGYDGKPCTEVTAEDVKDRPKVGDMANNPCGQTGGSPTSCNLPNPQATPQTPVPTPTSTSTPTSSGPLDPGTYPSNTAGDPPEPQALPMDPVFNWFPNISSIHIDVSSAGCPTWHMEPFGWQLTMDSHCAFIQQNQSLISVIMIVGFTIGAAMIILRA